MQKELMIRLKSQFQKLLFIRLIKTYGSSIKAGDILKIPASSVRGYKNLYFSSIPEKLLEKLSKLNLTYQQEIEENTLSKFLKEDQMHTSLNLGREIRKNNLILLKNAIPPISEIISNNKLDFEKWFKNYFHLLNSGFRKSTFSIEKDTIKIRYNNFTKQGNKKFEVIIPKEFILDNEFIYFFGLWCGDRAGGKRFGICNQNKEIIKFTEQFLTNHHQKIQKILYVSELIEEPNIKYDKKFILKTDKKGWVLSTHSGNGILVSFFIYLKKYLDEFLELADYKAFFAGLLDAAGNVSISSATVSGTTPAAADTTAPTVPSSLTATAVSSTQINLSWSASTDVVGVTGYRVYRDGSLVGTSLGTTFSSISLSVSVSPFK